MENFTAKLQIDTGDPVRDAKIKETFKQWAEGTDLASQFRKAKLAALEMQVGLRAYLEE